MTGVETNADRKIEIPEGSEMIAKARMVQLTQGMSMGKRLS